MPPRPSRSPSTYRLPGRRTPSAWGLTRSGVTATATRCQFATDVPGPNDPIYTGFGPARPGRGDYRGRRSGETSPRRGGRSLAQTAPRGRLRSSPVLTRDDGHDAGAP